jgi:hypothetical protein
VRVAGCLSFTIIAKRCSTGRVTPLLPRITKDEGNNWFVINRNFSLLKINQFHSSNGKRNLHHSLPLSLAKISKFMTEMADWIRQFLLKGIILFDKSECKQIEWSCNGSTLAILLKSAQILLWDPVVGSKTIDTEIKYLDLIKWSLDDENVRN